MRSPSSFALLLVLALVASACSKDATTTPTAPTTPTISETFSGTINVNGAATHPFFTSATGTVTATITAIDPPESLTMGLSMGTWNGVACNIVLAADKAILTTVVTGTVSTTGGSLCIRVYDTGGLVGPTSYEVQVVHP